MYFYVYNTVEVSLYGDNGNCSYNIPFPLTSLILKIWNAETKLYFYKMSGKNYAVSWVHKNILSIKTVWTCQHYMWPHGDANHLKMIGYKQKPFFSHKKHLYTPNRPTFWLPRSPACEWSFQIEVTLRSCRPVNNETEFLSFYDYLLKKRFLLYGLLIACLVVMTVRLNSHVYWGCE